MNDGANAAWLSIKVPTFAIPSERRARRLSHGGKITRVLAQRGLDECKKRWLVSAAFRKTLFRRQVAPARWEVGGFLNLKFSHLTGVELEAWPDKMVVVTKQPTARGMGSVRKKKDTVPDCEKVPCQFLSAPSAGGWRVWVSERDVFKAARSHALPWNRKWPPVSTALSEPSDTCHSGARWRSAHHQRCGGCRQTHCPRLRSASRKYTRARQWKSFRAICLAIFPEDTVTPGQRLGVELQTFAEGLSCGEITSFRTPCVAMMRSEQFHLPFNCILNRIWNEKKTSNDLTQHLAWWQLLLLEGRKYCSKLNLLPQKHNSQHNSHANSHMLFTQGCLRKEGRII